jgi:hypothetical protein
LYSMTYDPNRRAQTDRDGMSGGAMAGIALVLALFLGVMFWAFASGDRQTASSPNSPPTITGQGRTRT